MTQGLVWQQVEEQNPLALKQRHTIFRARIPLGWLVSIVTDSLVSNMPVFKNENLTFVPDPDGTWGKAQETPPRTAVSPGQ